MKIENGEYEIGLTKGRVINQPNEKIKNLSSSGGFTKTHQPKPAPTKASNATKSIYHFSIKTISRSKGQSAVAASAYRAGEKLKDETTGEISDYTKKDGVLYSEIVGCDLTREKIWNMAEEAETRKNSTVAREFEVALPSEMTLAEQKELLLSFAQEINERHSVIVDLSIHAPSKGGDQRNTHAHLMLTTRRWDGEKLTEKSRELDDQKSGETEYWRERWAQLNQERGIDIDHRTLSAQGIDRVPEPHLGKEAVYFERRTGEKSDIRLRDEIKKQAPSHEPQAPIRPKNNNIFVAKKLNDEVLKSFYDFPLEQVFETVDYVKQYQEGADKFLMVTHKDTTHKIIINPTTKTWDDRNTKRKAGEPYRIGAVSLTMYLHKCKLPEAVQKLQKLQDKINIEKNNSRIRQEQERAMAKELKRQEEKNKTNGIDR